MAIQSFYVFKIKYKVIFKHRVFLSVWWSSWVFYRPEWRTVLEQYNDDDNVGIGTSVVQVQMCIYLDLQVSAAASYLYLSFLTHSNQLLCVIDFLGNKYGKWCCCFTRPLTH